MAGSTRALALAGQMGDRSIGGRGRPGAVGGARVAAQRAASHGAALSFGRQAVAGGARAAAAPAPARA